MLSEVPLPRLLEGMATALRDHVEPGVGDEFALMQLRAVGEVLRNLAGRVEWAADDLNDEIVARLELLDRLAAAGWPGAGAARPAGGPPFATTGAALEYRAALLPRVAQGLRWAQAGGDEPRRIAADHLREANGFERARLRSGMYS
jgi:hypothetical protein